MSFSPDHALGESPPFPFQLAAEQNFGLEKPWHSPNMDDRLYYSKPCSLSQAFA
jgi:hypothetical protein